MVRVERKIARMSATELQKVMSERFGEDVEIVTYEAAWRECAHRADYSGPAEHERECEYHRGEIADQKPALPVRTPGVERHAAEVRDLWDWLLSSPPASPAVRARYVVRTAAMADAVRDALGWPDGETLREDGETVQVSHMTVDRGVYRVLCLRVEPC